MDVITLRSEGFGLQLVPEAGGMVTRYWLERDAHTVRSVGKLIRITFPCQELREADQKSFEFRGQLAFEKNRCGSFQQVLFRRKELIVGNEHRASESF
jgi:hypothetical protein